jgi:hypothetical protein
MLWAILAAAILLAPGTFIVIRTTRQARARIHEVAGNEIGGPPLLLVHALPPAVYTVLFVIGFRDPDADLGFLGATACAMVIVQLVVLAVIGLQRTAVTLAVTAIFVALEIGFGIVAFLAGVGPQQRHDDLSAHYQIAQATRPDGKRYRGDVGISLRSTSDLAKRAAPIYDVHWTDKAGNGYDGTGAQLQFDFLVAYGEGERGAGYYDPDGTYVPLFGDRVPAHAIATGGKWPGSFDVDGGNVTIVERNGAYDITWTFGVHELKGVGLVLDVSRLAIAYVVDATPGIALYTISGRILDGHWYQRGDPAVGSELLRR